MACSECLPIEGRFIKQHRAADLRWSQGKLYMLRTRRKWRLRVTSANWSIAAWGAGKATPYNFELGVLFDSKWTELEALGQPFNPPDTNPLCVNSIDEEKNESALQWAEACWDGRRILLRARSSDLDRPITAFVTFTGGSQEGISLVGGDAVMPWKDPEYTQLTAQLRQGTEMLQVDVLDLRSPLRLRA